MTYSYESTTYWDDLLESEFIAESDRAAVIMTASIFENTLHSLLKNRLVPTPSTSDSLFESNAPLSTFSSKIDICYRIGLISSQFCRDLHLIRKIRNDFAHNIQGCDFSNNRAKQRVLELAKSSNIIEKCQKIRGRFEEGTRGDFLMVASWMLWSLNSKIEKEDIVNECPKEFGYTEFKDDQTTNHVPKTS